MSEVADVLRRAEHIIGEKGWTRGRYERRGRVCMVQAISDAIAGPSLKLRFACYEAVHQVIGWRSLSKWNDEPGRKKREVRAALLAAADQTERAS